MAVPPVPTIAPESKTETAPELVTRMPTGPEIVPELVMPPANVETRAT